MCSGARPTIVEQLGDPLGARRGRRAPGHGSPAPRRRSRPPSCAGSSDANGSWKMIWARRRKARRFACERPMTSSPSKWMVPAVGSTRRSRLRPTVVLPRARLADESESLAALDVEGDVVDRLDVVPDPREQAALGRKPGPEMADLDQRGSHQARPGGDLAPAPAAHQVLAAAGFRAPAAWHRRRRGRSSGSAGGSGSRAAGGAGSARCRAPPRAAARPRAPGRGAGSSRAAPWCRASWARRRSRRPSRSRPRRRHTSRPPGRRSRRPRRGRG